MSGQLSLDFGDAVDRLYATIRKLVDRHGLQQVALHIERSIGREVQPQTISHALARRKRHRIPIDYLPALATMPGGEEIASILAGLCGFDLVESRPATPEELAVAWEMEVREEFGERSYYGCKRGVQRRVVEMRTGRLTVAGGDDR